MPLDSDDALVTLNGLYEQVKGDHDFEEFRYAENCLVLKIFEYALPVFIVL